MLVVETIAKIRRAYFVQGKSIKAICRELGVSRKVVRKVLRSGATEFSYERKVQPKPKIGPIKDALDAVEYATLKWVDWYNNRRLLEPIGNIPPAGTEAVYFASLKETAIAA